MSEEILHADANAAELARTRAELTALRAAYDQAERALDAERAARRGAEADVAALREILTAFERSVNESVSGIRRHSADEWLLLLGKAQGVGGEHPGASLLAELAAAQAVIKTLRAWMTREARLSALEAALAKYDQVRGGQADGSS